MTNENIEAVELKRTAQKINREDEGRITQVLIDYLISLQQNDDVAMMDPDGDLAIYFGEITPQLEYVGSLTAGSGITIDGADTSESQLFKKGCSFVNNS